MPRGKTQLTVGASVRRVGCDCERTASAAGRLLGWVTSTRLTLGGLGTAGSSTGTAGHRRGLGVGLPHEIQNKKMPNRDAPPTGDNSAHMASRPRTPTSSSSRESLQVNAYKQHWQRKQRSVAHGTSVAREASQRAQFLHHPTDYSHATWATTSTQTTVPTRPLANKLRPSAEGGVTSLATLQAGNGTNKSRDLTGRQQQAAAKTVTNRCDKHDTRRCPKHPQPLPADHARASQQQHNST